MENKVNSSESPAKVPQQSQPGSFRAFWKLILVVFLAPFAIYCLQPAFEWAKTFLFWVVGAIFGEAGWQWVHLVDDLYDQALRNRFQVETAIVTMSCVFLVLAFSWGIKYLVTGESWLKQIRKRPITNSDKKFVKVAANFLVFVVIFVVGAGFTDEILFMGLQHQFEVYMAIATPRISNQQDREFRARFVLVRTKADYDKLLEDVEAASSQGKEEE